MYANDKNKVINKYSELFYQWDDEIIKKIIMKYATPTFTSLSRIVGSPFPVILVDITLALFELVVNL